MSKGEAGRGTSWFDKLTTNGRSPRTLSPFVLSPSKDLSLSKGEAGRGTSWFDKLTTNGSPRTFSPFVLSQSKHEASLHPHA